MKWMAVAKLLTVKGSSEQSLEETMRAAWNLACELIFRPIEKNLFMMQVSYLGDWDQITQEGSWLFRDWVLMIEEFDDATTTPSVMPIKFKPRFRYIIPPPPPSVSDRSNTEAASFEGGRGR
jgi:hypothetical protein